MRYLGIAEAGRASQGPRGGVGVEEQGYSGGWRGGASGTVDVSDGGEYATVGS